MKVKDIKCCSKICKTCGFSKKGTKDTLYADIYKIIEAGVVFPCHEYLQKHTGSENTGVEKLDKIEVCRGYVAFIKKTNTIPYGLYPHWDKLFDEVTEDDMKKVYDSDVELVKSHQGLWRKIFLRN